MSFTYSEKKGKSNLFLNLFFSDSVERLYGKYVKCWENLEVINRFFHYFWFLNSILQINLPIELKY